MKKENVFALALGAGSAAYIACTVIFCLSIWQAAENGSRQAAVIYIISACLFALGELIPSVACIAGKMKDEKSLVYSVSRLFIIVFCINSASKCPALYVGTGVMVLMYIVSLNKDMKKYSARNSKHQEVK